MEFKATPDKLNELAAQFWNYVKKERLFAFHGEMGAGKTTIIGALCAYKGVKKNISSPTFSIINEYSFYENGQDNTIYHIDLYRLKDQEEAVRAGVEDCVYSDAICMVEWPERAPGLFEGRTVHVFIEPVSETERDLNVILPENSPKELRNL